MVRALFVVSEEGYWGEECIEPLTTLSDAGVEITVGTPSGAPPEIDDRSLDPEMVGEETAEWVREVDETDERLNDPIPVASAEAGDYDALVLPGGHGTVWDINQDRHVRDLLRDTIENGDKALVVCHAVGILGFTWMSDGSRIAEGRDITGFPNAQEEEIVDEYGRMDDGRKLPYWVEDEIIDAGGNWDAELDAETSVSVDGDLITGRGPASSAEAARTLLSELGIEQTA